MLVITIDGPSGSGKGTLALMVASALGFHLLDSGALYRLLALAALKQGVTEDDEVALAALAEHLPVSFVAGEEGEPAKVLLAGNDVGDDIRQEKVGEMASRIAPFTAVRAALLERQRAFSQAPGLVADGRDMGTVVFPDSPLKFYLTASAEERANRRYKQLKSKGFDASLSRLIEDLKARDDRDMNRSTAPLRPAADADVIDSSELSIDEVFQRVMTAVVQQQS